MSFGFSNRVKLQIGVPSNVKHAIVNNVRHTENRCTSASVAKPYRKREVTIFFAVFLSSFRPGAPTFDGAALSPWHSGSIYWVLYLLSWHPLKSCTILSALPHFLGIIFLTFFPPWTHFLSPISPAVWVPFFPFVPRHPFGTLSESLKFPAVPTTNQPLHALIKTTVDYSETPVRSFQIARRYIPRRTNFHTPQYEHKMNTCLTPCQFCYFFTVLFRLNTVYLLQLK